MNNTINNRNRDDDGKYAKWDVCDYEGCKNVLGDLDDGAWAFGTGKYAGDFLCLNHDADDYENGEEAFSGVTHRPIQYQQAR